MANDNVILRFVLYGDPRTKKNSQIPIIAKTKSGAEYIRIIPSNEFTKYERTCLRQITGKQRLMINQRINCCYLWFMKTHRVVDKTNLQEAMDDILKDAKVVTDDNCRVIAGHDGSRVYYDKDNPRVEVTITKLEDEDNGYQLV